MSNPPSPGIAPAELAILRQRPLLVAGLLVAGLLGVVLVAFPPHYMTNDDVVMDLVVSGRAFDDAPDEHLVFSNILIGKALSALYRTQSNVPWYGGYLLALQALSLAAICYILIRANPSRVQLLLTAAFLASFGILALSWLQFTVVAFSATLAGLLLLSAAAEQRAGRAAWWVGPIFLLAGALVRLDAAGLAGLVTGPLVLATLIGSADLRRRLLFALTLAAPLAIGYGLDRFNGWYYANSPGWEGFYEFNALRAQFTDYDRVPPGEGTATARALAGWSETDLHMLNEWSFANPERYSTANFKAVLAAAPATQGAPGRSWRQLFDVLGRDLILRTLLALGAAGCVLPGQERRARFVGLLCLLAAVSVAIVLYFFRHLPPRVYLPAFAVFPVVTAALSVARADRRWIPRQPLPAGTLAVAAILLLLEILPLLGTANAWRKQHDATVAMMARLAPRSDRLYVLWGHNFPLENLVAPLETSGVPADFKAVGLGWTTRTPFTERRLGQFAITDLDRSLYEGKVPIFTTRERVQLLSASLAEHFGPLPQWEVVFKDPALDNTVLFRAVASTPLD
jgi:hypothetical protein